MTVLEPAFKPARCKGWRLRLVTNSVLDSRDRRFAASITHSPLEDIPMTVIDQMLDSYPKDLGIDRAVLAECIAACLECSQACTACADACLSEDMVADLVQCISTDLNCADICAATANVLSRRTKFDVGLTRAIVEACRTACATCANECEQHADMHDHCKVCAAACRRCEQACAALLESIR